MADLEKITKKRLGEILLAEGVINQDQLAKALAMQQQSGELIGEALVKSGFTTETEIAKTLCAQFGKPFLRPTKYDIAKEVLALLPPRIMAEHSFIPVDRFGNLIVIALGGLLDANTVAQIQRFTNCEIEVYVSTASDVKQALRQAFPDFYDPITLAPKLDAMPDYNSTMGFRASVTGASGRPPEATSAIRGFGATQGVRAASSLTGAFSGVPPARRPEERRPDDRTLGTPALGRGNGSSTPPAGGGSTGKGDTQRRNPEIPDTRKMVTGQPGDFSVTNSQLGMTTGELRSLKAEEDSDWDALFQEAEENVMRRLEADGGPTGGSDFKKK